MSCSCAHRRFLGAGLHLSQLSQFRGPSQTDTLNPVHMQITSLKVGPDVAGMVDTLFLTCLSLLWAIEPFARAFDATGLADQLQKELQRFCQLPRNEPIV